MKKARRQDKSDSASRGEQGVLVELHDNGYIQYQSFKDQITGVDEPEEEPRDDHPVEFYAPLVGTRHIDP